MSSIIFDFKSAVLIFNNINLESACKGLDECLIPEFNFIDYFSDGIVCLELELRLLKACIIKGDLLTLFNEVLEGNDFRLILGIDGSNGFANDDLCDLVELIRALMTIHRSGIVIDQFSLINYDSIDSFGLKMDLNGVMPNKIVLDISNINPDCTGTFLDFDSLKGAEVKMVHYKNDISNFLNTHTSIIRNIRDHLPSGFEHFKLFEGEVQFEDFYSFIDAICSKRPLNFKIVLSYGVIAFNEISLKWGILENESDKVFVELLDALNELSKNSCFLRDFLRFKSIKSDT